MATKLASKSPAAKLKLNLGCGHNKLMGFVNVDLSDVCKPDQVVDLNKTPWPWKKNAVDEVVMHHALEHMGATSEGFLAIMQELYRVCTDGAVVRITVPHPRHDNFQGDPTHVRVITPQLLSLFSRANCDAWQAQGASNTPLAHYLDVDFEMAHAEAKLDEPYASALNNGQITPDQAAQFLRERNNVGLEFIIQLRVKKT